MSFSMNLVSRVAVLLFLVPNIVFARQPLGIPRGTESSTEAMWESLRESLHDKANAEEFEMRRSMQEEEDAAVPTASDEDGMFGGVFASQEGYPFGNVFLNTTEIVCDIIPANLTIGPINLRDTCNDGSQSIYDLFQSLWGAPGIVTDDLINTVGPIMGDIISRVSSGGNSTSMIDDDDDDDSD